MQNYKFYDLQDLQDKIHIKHKSKFWFDLQHLLPIPFFFFNSFEDPTKLLVSFDTLFVYQKHIYIF